MRLRSGILKSAIGLSYAVGAHAIWSRIKGGNIKVLMYHGVSGNAEFPGVANHYGYNVSVKNFEQQLVALKRHCNLISLQDMLSGRGLSSKRTNIIITFDDGYENLYRQAFPLLQKLNVPALIGLPTAFILKHEPLWNDVVEYAVVNSSKQLVRIYWEDDEREFNLQEPGGRLSLYEWLLFKCVTIEQEKRRDFLQAVGNSLDVNLDSKFVFQDDDYRPLSCEQIKEMVNSGLIEFGSHSVHHLLLAKMKTTAKRLELRESRKEIEKLTGVSCTSFCVPGGSYDAELVEEAFDAGYNCVLTSDMGLVETTDRVLNRNCIMQNYNISKFVDMVYGPVQALLQSGRQAFASR